EIWNDLRRVWRMRARTAPPNMHMDEGAPAHPPAEAPLAGDPMRHAVLQVGYALAAGHDPDHPAWGTPEYEARQEEELREARRYAAAQQRLERAVAEGEAPWDALLQLQRRMRAVIRHVAAEQWLAEEDREFLNDLHARMVRRLEWKDSSESDVD